MFDPAKCDHISTTVAKEREKQNPMAELANIASIAFVVLAEKGHIDEVTATEHISQFNDWIYPDVCVIGNIRQYAGKLYRCIRNHTSQSDWTPDKAVSLWVEIGNPAEEWKEWSQPQGAHDAYDVGDKVTYMGDRYICVAGVGGKNSWRPDEYGWEKQ